MQHRTLNARLGSLDHNLGSVSLGLQLGNREVDLAGLDEPLVAELKQRWGGFVKTGRERAPDCTVRFYRGGEGAWLDLRKPGESYRVESVGDGTERVVASYHFALQREGERSVWRVGISDAPDEPLPRVVENVVRFLCAHLALDDGGFALHAAGVLKEDRAFLLAGPSRAGKTTASRLVGGAESLGDDFGMVVREESDWRCPALPFDNTERVENRPSSGLYDLAGVWRVHQAAETRVEKPSTLASVSGLTGCAAFAWAMPERAEELLDHVREFAKAGLFRELHFGLEEDLWPHIATPLAP